MGMGFVLTEGDIVLMQGQKCAPRAKAPIHTEANGLIWAMTEAREKALMGLASVLIVNS